MSNKYFIITIDTEGDNLWGWKEGMPLYTENALFLPRFQRLCEKYQFIPTWLCNWEMLSDDRFVQFARDKYENKLCDLGMHLHAWNTPPYFELPRMEKSKKPYLIEYPVEIMDKKIAAIHSLFQEKLGINPVVHRSGRWAINEVYFELLRKYGYIADCSITPHISWEKSWGQTPGFAGPDYSNEEVMISKRNGVLEIPVTTYRDESMNKTLWIRPNGNNLDEMLSVIEFYKNSNYEYLMFMIHSSEMMPGGSPTFPTKESIETLYMHLEVIFEKISNDYEGIGLSEFAQKVQLF